MEKIPSHIICLLLSSLKGQLNNADQKQLQNWLEAHPEHYKEIKQLEMPVRSVIQPMVTSIF